MNEWSIDSEVIDTVNEQVEGIFTKLVELYNLQHGDVTPEQVNELEIAKETLIGIADQYVRQNGEAA